MAKAELLQIPESNDFSREGLKVHICLTWSGKCPGALAKATLDTHNIANELFSQKVNEIILHIADGTSLGSHMYSRRFFYIIRIEFLEHLLQ